MDKINILWTTTNKDTIFNMLSMYAINSIHHNWWKEVNIIIWGASARLAGNDSQVQTEIIEMISQGVRIEACRDCCDNFGVSDTLSKLGVNVRYLGESLTGYLKMGEKVITL
jgi:hypothetical protein